MSKLPELRDSKTELREDFFRMYKSMTDPVERAKEARQKELREYKEKKQNYYGL